MKKIIVSDIEYDLEKEDLELGVDLPKSLEIEVSSDLEDEYEIEEFISDEISNITGFCHKGFSMKEM